MGDKKKLIKAKVHPYTDDGSRKVINKPGAKAPAKQDKTKVKLVQKAKPSSNVKMDTPDKKKKKALIVKPKPKKKAGKITAGRKKPKMKGKGKGKKDSSEDYTKILEGYDDLEEYDDSDDVAKFGPANGAVYR